MATKSSGKAAIKKAAKQDQQTEKSKNPSSFFSPGQKSNVEKNLESSIMYSSKSEDFNQSPSSQTENYITTDFLKHCLEEQLVAITAEFNKNTAETKKQFLEILEKLKQSEEKITALEYESRANKEQNEQLYNQMRQIEGKLGDLEDRLRRNNLRIRNVPEEITQDKIPEYLDTLWATLKIEVSILNTKMDQYHRLSKPSSVSQHLPRDIIINLQSHQFKEAILYAARTNQSNTEKLGDIKIFQDFSFYTRQQRKKFMTVTGSLRRLNIKYSWIYPSKIKIITDGRREIFTTPSQIEEWLRKKEK
ncbi:Hypothetical predicted protein [Pelobates cultripes]|uniref:L1 transposable element RRM domain-containing protein n=1 Tax=Pelobates cultripes TaxID=61616 RepID=A0AAD1SFB1_PELCU|nr:Hypothetical predicted protein [Pelobates cultripes]